jgi:hypothetical protein
MAGMQQRAVRVYTDAPRTPGAKALWLGLAGSLLARLSRTRLPKVTCEDLKKNNYSTSTQRIGVRFTERIRNAFRFRWIREIF